MPEGSNRVVFEGQCAELCGRNHANMYARVIGMRLPGLRGLVRGKARPRSRRTSRTTRPAAASKIRAGAGGAE